MRRAGNSTTPQKKPLLISCCSNFSFCVVLCDLYFLSFFFFFCHGVLCINLTCFFGCFLGILSRSLQADCKHTAFNNEYSPYRICKTFNLFIRQVFALIHVPKQKTCQSNVGILFLGDCRQVIVGLQLRDKTC